MLPFRSKWTWPFWNVFKTVPSILNTNFKIAFDRVNGFNGLTFAKSNVNVETVAFRNHYISTYEKQSKIMQTRKWYCFIFSKWWNNLKARRVLRAGTRPSQLRGDEPTLPAVTGDSKKAYVSKIIYEFFNTHSSELVFPTFMSIYIFRLLFLKYGNNIFKQCLIDVQLNFIDF